MKRVVEISVDEGRTKIKIKASITHRGSLTRTKVGEMTDELASRIMATIPKLPYSHLKLVDIKIK